jgi:hypothetical protein
MSTLLRGRLRVVVQLCCGLISCAAGSFEAPGQSALLLGATNSGETLARASCGSCHLFPEPELLDKKTWSEQTLPRMSIRLGLAPQEIERHPEASLLKATGVFPTQPMIADADWKAIVNYYLRDAPATPRPQGPRPEIQLGLGLFDVEKPKHRMPVPSTTLVKISERERKVYLGDAETKALGIYTFDGKPPTAAELTILASFDLVFFSCNGICMVDHEGRLAILKEVRRILLAHSARSACPAA